MNLEVLSNERLLAMLEDFKKKSEISMDYFVEMVQKELTKRNINTRKRKYRKITPDNISSYYDCEHDCEKFCDQAEDT